jgi:hypothetical protein
VSNAQSTPTSFEIEGQTVHLPVQVRSAAMAGAQWFVDGDAAQDVVAPVGLDVVRNRKGKAVVSITSVAYADNDLGPYHEIALAFVVNDPWPDAGRKPRMGEVATYIHRLPVNQAFTCAAGRGIWGFPKWVCDIDIAERHGAVETTMVDDGRMVIGLSVPTGGIPVPARELNLVSFSAADGELHRTPFTSRSVGLRIRPRGAAQLVLGDGDMADDLRALGISGAPFLTMTCPRAVSTFGASTRPLSGGATA